MPKYKDITGRLFTRLTAIRYVGPDKYQSAVWEVRCECGVVKTATAPSLLSGNTRSCGCLKRELDIAHCKAMATHRMSGTPEHNAWHSMKQRVLNPNDTAAKNYGGRGITVCERWLLFENFYADMGPRPDGLTLERKDNNGNYEPGNCEWATRTKQSRNRRNRRNNVTVGGYPIHHVMEELGGCYTTWQGRMNRNPDLWIDIYEEES